MLCCVSARSPEIEQRNRKDKASASELMKVGDFPAPKDLDVSELAGWTSVARVLLNLHETITRN